MAKYRALVTKGFQRPIIGERGVNRLQSKLGENATESAAASGQIKEISSVDILLWDSYLRSQHAHVIEIVFYFLCCVEFSGETGQCCMCFGGPIGLGLLQNLSGSYSIE
jgi:hypothetical protein